MNVPFLSTLSAAFDYVSRASLLGTVAIALVFLIRWTIGERLAPSARSWLWLPVVLVCCSPQLPGLVDWSFSAQTLPLPAQEAFIPAAETAVVVRGEPRPLSAVPEARPAASVPRFTFKEKAAMGWAAGSFTLLLFWGVAYAGLWRRIRRHQNPVDDGLAVEFQACVRLSGFRRPPRLILSSGVESPAVAGLWRPVVLMPPRMVELLGVEALRHVLLHELAHLRRKDLWLHWGAALVVAVHWFNPFVWLASRKFRGDRESACDATVIGMDENRAHAYGQTLLTLESRVMQPVALRLMAGILGGADLVRQRIVDITRFGKTSRRAAWLSFLAALSGAAVIALAAAEPAIPRSTPSKSEATTQTRPATDALYTRTFKVTPDFLKWTQVPETRPPGDPFRASARKTTAIEVLKSLGVHFPEGASATFIPYTSQLIVRNSQAHLDFIESIVDARMNTPVRQVHVRSHLVVFKEGAGLPSMFGGPAAPPEKAASSEVPPQAHGMGSLMVQHPVPHPETLMAVAGVFTDAQFQALLASLLGKPAPDAKAAPADHVTFPLQDISSKVEAVVGLPSVTTRSGQKAAVEVAREFIFPTEYAREVPKKDGEGPRYVPKTFETRPIGIILEVDPVVGPDGYTIDLNLKPQMPAFTGWMDYPLDNGGKIRNPILHSNTVTTAVTIWDGQTIAFGGQAFVPAFLMNPALKGEAALASKKHAVMIFVTATMIDPTGKPEKKDAPKGEKVGTPEKEPASPAPDTKGGTSDGLSISRGRLQFQVRKADTGEIDGASMKAFVESQVAVLLGKEARTRAVNRVKTLHPELKPVAVDFGISRLPDTGQVIIEASGKNEAYVAHFLNCLLDETIALRKEAVEKSLGGSLNKMLEDALAAQKGMKVAAVQYEQAVKSGASKEKINRLEEELERAKATHHLWMQRLGKAEGSTLVTGEAKILERPAFVEGKSGR